MKIYIASSWKNEAECLRLANDLRARGHEVDCFCDRSQGRFVFHYREIGPPDELDAVTFFEDTRSQRAYREDKHHLDWAEVVVMLLPCGKSAHLEAGYKRGQGGHLFILGDFPKGEIDVMYGFADRLIRLEEIEELYAERDRLDQKKRETS